MNKLASIVFIISFLVLGVSCQKEGAESNKTAHEGPKQKVFYTCSMHPQIKEDKPGKCPICHMNLTKVEIKNNYSSNVASSFAKKKLSFNSNKIKILQSPKYILLNKDYIIKKKYIYWRFWIFIPWFINWAFNY